MTDPQRRIMVVDNNPVIIKLMEDFLLRHGHTVECARDALDCLDRLAVFSPDIIFVDLVMPKISGDDLCRILRSLDHVQDCYIAIISAIAMEQDLDYRRYGADCCIAKGPFKEMSRHVLQAIHDSTQPRPAVSDHTIKGAENLHERQITRELLRQNSHHRLILESIAQGIMEIESNRIVYMNQQAADIIGFDSEKLLGRDAATVLPGHLFEAIEELPTDERSRILATDSDAIEINERQILLERFPVKHGHDDHILVITDITDRKKMEAVIEATNLAQNLGYVFSGIRHEIGNPVNSIKVALSVLKRNLDQYDRHTIAEFADRSLQEVEQIEYLLKALKNYSLFEKPDITPLSATDFIRQFISLISNDFAEKDISVQQIGNDESLVILADSRALHHVMLNLMTNAADALEGRERPQIVVSVARNGNWGEIKVHDNGKGISQNDHKNLFTPFFTGKPTGTGLGLVIVKKMLSAMNGTIGIESYEGIGTTVTISLPEPDTTNHDSNLTHH